MYKVSVYAGYNKSNQKEDYEIITIQSGDVIAIVGDTGSGKSRFIKDIEQMVQGESITRRKISIMKDGTICEPMPSDLIAHLGQNMRFMLDCNVEEFIQLHAQCREVSVDIQPILDLANTITPEHIHAHMLLNMLSGGQTRALMIADIALICDSPIVLIDEIENAGIDKIKALNALIDNQKMVLIVTHDPHTALMSEQRIIMKNGGVHKLVQKTQAESILCKQMDSEYTMLLQRQIALRKGETLR